MGPTFFSNYDFSIQFYRVDQNDSAAPDRYRAFLFDPLTGESQEFYNIDGDAKFFSVNGDGYSEFTLTDSSGQSVASNQLEDLTDYKLNLQRETDGLQLSMELKNVSSSSNGNNASVFDGRLTELGYRGRPATTFTYLANDRGNGFDVDKQLRFATIDDGMGVVATPTYAFQFGGYVWDKVDVTGFDPAGSVEIDYVYTGQNVTSIKRNGTTIMTYAYTLATNGSGNTVQTWENLLHWGPQRKSSMEFTGEYESGGTQVYNQYSGIVVRRMDAAGTVYAELTPAATEGMYDITYRGQTMEWVPNHSLRFGTETTYASVLNSTESQVGLGQPLTYVDETGYEVDYEYDTSGNRIKTIHPDSSYELTLYDDDNLVVYQRDRGGYVTVTERDSEGRVVRSITGLKDNDDAVDDDSFLVPTGALPLQKINGYNAAGLLEWTTTNAYQPGGFSVPAANTRTDSVYDANDRLDKMILPKLHGQTTRSEVEYTWTSARLTKTKNERGFETNYVHDSFDRVISTDYTGGSSEQVWYNDSTKSLYRKDRNGQISKTIYDTAWRPEYRHSAYATATSIYGATDESGMTILPQYLQQSTRHAYGLDRIQPEWTYQNEGSQTQSFYDFRGRNYKTVRYPRAGVTHTSENFYEKNMLFSTEVTTPGYTQRTYRGYSSDRQTVRLIKTRMSTTTFADNDAVLNAVRHAPNALDRDHEISDAIRDLRGKHCIHGR